MNKIARIFPALALCTALYAHANVDISDIPLYAIQGVAPNFAVTLDDSGSMAWGYVPDGISNRMDTRRGRSADFNAQYYSPNVQYEIPPGIWDPVTGTHATLTTSWPVAFINGFRTASGTRNLSTNYRISWSYNPANNSETLGTKLAGEPDSAFYYVYDESLPNCNNLLTNDNCYRRVDVSATSGPGGTDERQNFAIWYSFYRQRNLATVSAASIAFSELPPSIRVGWQALNSCTNFFTGNSCRGYYINSTNDFPQAPSAVARFEGNHKRNFYRWLQRLPASGGTPLLPSVERVETMYATDRPYWHTPGVQQNPMYECRPNISLVMTDGIWNGSTASTTVGNADNQSWSLPDGQNYSPMRPYQSSHTRNLSDIAFRQWARDLRTDLPQSDANRRMKVSTNETHGSVTLTPYWNPKNDPSTWQNIITYTLGVGLTGFLGDDWQGNTYTGAYTDFVSGARDWPTTGLNAIPGNVFDLWHAALNGRGEFFSADSPEEAVTAFRDIISNVLDRTGSAAAVSMSSPRVSPNSLAYQVGFDTNDWSGELRAYKLSDGTGTGAACNSLPKGHVCDSPEWEASNLLDNLNWNTGRNIITNAGGSGSPFRWTSLTTAQQNALDQGQGLGSLRLEYLRGNRAEEGNGHTVGADTITFRTRSTVLGDIMNAQPAPLHVGPPSLFISDSSYQSFKTTYENRQHMIYVGANDGMLHAFNAETGQEVFAFVPAAVYPNLHLYTQSDYEHASFVDGGLNSFDVQIGGQWRTVLVGSLGLGGRSIFALDITNPASFSEGNASSMFMWEFTDADLGYVLGAPEIVLLRNDQWAAVFPGGYNSTSGVVALFVVDIATGNLIRKIPVGTDATNGLGPIATVDLYGTNNTHPADGKIEYVVAGDLKGNLWVFNLLHQSNVNQWGSAFASGGSPIPAFVARDAANVRQPITSAPTVGRHPTNEGMMVYFGTGRYLGAGDLTDLQTQTFYGVWVKEGNAHNTGMSRADLLQQEILLDDTTAFLETDARATTNHTINWDAPNNHLGWYLDFNTEPGERVFQKPILRTGRIIFVSSTPSDNPCLAGGTSWIYELNAVSGSRLSETPFDYNFNGTLDSSDFVSIPTPTGGTELVPGSGIRLRGDVGMIYLSRESIVDAGETESKTLSTAAGQPVSITESKAQMTHRTWRELVGN